MSSARVALAAAAAALLLGGAAKPPTADAEEAFRTLRLSHELARRARAAEDPLLLLAAARLRRSVPLTISAPEADRAAEWIEEAERFGAADPRVASLAADVRAEAPKGRIAGPRVAASFLGAGQRRDFVEDFRVGATAVVYVEGDGDSDLALRVDTPSGVACRDMGPGDVKLCAWTPKAREPVRVEVTNVGPVKNRFILGTN